MKNISLAVKAHGGTWFGVLCNEQRGILACSFSESRTSLERHLRAGAQETVSPGFTTESRNALDQMINLYEGRKTTGKVSLDWGSVSGFQKSVCQRMLEIPKGRVTSYGMIAKRINSGPRAVGTAVGGNPWPLFVPCHRVVPASLEIGNYSIGGALSDYGCGVKRELLEREGVSIDGEKIASKALWVPTGV